LRWYEEQRCQDGVNSMVDDVRRGQSSSHLGWDTVSDVLVYQHASSGPTTSTVNVCRPTDGPQTFTRKDDVIRGTATSSSRQQYELARNRAIYDDIQPFEPKHTSSIRQLSTEVNWTLQQAEFKMKSHIFQRTIVRRCKQHQLQLHLQQLHGGRNGAMSSLMDNQHDRVAPAFAAATATTSAGAAYVTGRHNDDM